MAILLRDKVSPLLPIGAIARATDEIFVSRFDTLREPGPTATLEIAKEDWRITQRHPDSQLLNKIWSSIYTRFRTQHAEQRAHFLREAKGVAVFQPDRMEELIGIAMDQPAEPGRDWPFLRERTQEDVLVTVPALLGVTIFHESTSNDAFRRLWVLAEHKSIEVHTRARKELKEAIGYHKYKNVIYNERILALVERLASGEESYGGDFTPLSLIDELMDREVEDTNLRGLTFSFTALPVNYSAIQEIRNRALRIIDAALYSASPRIAVCAASSLKKVISEFHPRFGAEPTQEEHQWQDLERLAALDLIAARITSGELSLQLTWKFDRLLAYIERRDAQSDPVKQRAVSLRAALSRPELFNVFDVLTTDEYEDAILEGIHTTIPESRRKQEEQALAELRNTFSEADSRVRSVEELSRQAVDAGIEPVSLGLLLRRLCQENAFLRALTEFVLRENTSILASIAALPLCEWRDVDASEYEKYGVIFAHSSNFRLAEAAANAVSYGPSLSSPIPEDVIILTILARRQEGRVLGPTLFGLKQLVPVPRYCAAALDLYANMRVGNDNFFGTYGLSAEYLNSSTVELMLEKLVEVDELDRDAFGGLLAKTFRVAPLAFVEFFEKENPQATFPSSDQRALTI